MAKKTFTSELGKISAQEQRLARIVAQDRGVDPDLEGFSIGRPDGSTVRPDAAWQGYVPLVRALLAAK